MPLRWLASRQTCNQKAVHLGEAWSCHLKPGQLYTPEEQKFHLKTEWEQGLESQLGLVPKMGWDPFSRHSGRRPAYHCGSWASLRQSDLQRMRLVPFTPGNTLCSTWSTDPETSRIMCLQIPGPPVVKSGGHKICHCIYCAGTTC